MKRSFALVISTVALGLVSALAAGDGWTTAYPQAVERAKREKKVLLLDFNGSDWCPPCIALKKQVFETEEFKKFAAEKLVLVDVDFPRRKKLPKEVAEANEKLAEKFKVESFPTVLLVDTNGKVLHREEGYADESAKDYIALLKKALK
jgi:thioredoxin-related protein